ncbi:radical SAM protein [Dissulfurirhabdus thermomarina]|uniref:Radical SAM protein n=1 Tax=Dissulfurirhabdus thermomarina TaxID=1765737 RepID=A0A6N9TPZ5_DISTH|nr:radical SAM protein [Dissulfurirhabdus thermomarina]NDY43118.1 radical SAM protein [Dissulfurirhabdus thermomarina]NMX23765.1 radical SAM protein [Dissulfurirhabdus thermomarina]
MADFEIPAAVSNQILGMAGKLSNQNLLRIVGLLERFASIDWHHRGIAAIKRMIEEDHQGIEAVRRIVQRANPQARSALVNAFFLGAILLGYKRRYAFWQRHQVAPPGTLMISPTVRCNLRCYGCYAAHHEPRQELTRQEVEGVVREATAAGTNFIMFMGGEPFVVPWLLDVIAAFPKTAFLIYTNGLLIDDAKVRRLAELGNAAVAIGIDGLEAETDRRKGPGAFRGAVAVMKRLSDAGVITGFSTMVSRRNYDEIYSDAFIDTMIEHGAGFGWMAVALPQGRACEEPDLIPTPEQKAGIKARIQRLRQRKPILLVDFYNDAEITEGCGAASLTMHVNVNGDVEPCVLMPFAVDNIREKPFTEILCSDFFKGLRRIRESHPPGEQTCMWVYCPREVRDVVHRSGARPTSRGVMEKLDELADAQDG